MLNTTNQVDYGAIIITKVISLIFSFAVISIFPLIFRINPDKTYGWFAGAFHGGWAPSNYIFSLFSDSWLIIAPCHTTAYTVFFWFNCVLLVLMYLHFIVDIIAVWRASRA